MTVQDVSVSFAVDILRLQTMRGQIARRTVHSSDGNERSRQCDLD